MSGRVSVFDQALPEADDIVCLIAERPVDEIVMHDDASVVGNRGCDDQFEFALDLMLDGLERLKDRVDPPPSVEGSAIPA